MKIKKTLQKCYNTKYHGADIIFCRQFKTKKKKNSQQQKGKT